MVSSQNTSGFANPDTLILSPIIRHRNSPYDSDSTEDMLNAVQEANVKLDSNPEFQEDLSIFSMDAKALVLTLKML